jgi:RNA polymerase sigma factor (sigma-70 family)
MTPAFSWNDIPAPLQQRVLDRGLDVVDELAAWAYENRPAWLKLDDLQDLLGAVIVFLLRKRDRARLNIRSLPALLTSIAYRQKCQRFREEGYRRREAFVARPEDASTPPEHVVRLEARVLLMSALGTLNAAERDAILRKHVAGESYRQIAVALYGRSGEREEGRVSVMLARARKKLRDHLGDGTLLAAR